jgi:hypothetical protein
MAVITCVFHYDEDNGVSLVTHVITVDVHDKIQFVTDTPGLTLKAENDFPLLDLKKGDYAPVRYTNNLPTTDGAHEFQVYYHGDIVKLSCGTLDAHYSFASWPRTAGQSAPGSGGGGRK